jgi:AcrR family transcriptional regulator
MTEKPTKRERTRALLIATALELLDERDWDDVTVEEIAEEAGMVKTTVFNHFGTKADLLLAAVEELYAEAEAALVEIRNAPRPRFFLLQDVPHGLVPDELGRRTIKGIEVVFGLLRAHPHLLTVLRQVHNADGDDPLAPLLFAFVELIGVAVRFSYPRHRSGGVTFYAKPLSVEKLVSLLTVAALHERTPSQATREDVSLAHAVVTMTEVYLREYRYF